MFEPTERDVDTGVQRSIEMFERAKVGEVAPVEPRVPQRLLVALDGSSQDATSLSICGALERRFRCTLQIMDGREGVDNNELAARAAEPMSARALDKLKGDSYQQILEAIDRSGCDLAVVPSPFGRDLETVGSDSTGTVIDVLVARSSVPLLIVREPYTLEEEPFERVVMVLIGENEAAAEAARWTAGMIAPHGQIELLLVLEREVLENVQSLMHSLDPDAEITAEVLSDALARSHVRLHRALQKSANRLGVRYRLDVRQDSADGLSELSTGPRHPLLMLAHERTDHRSQGHIRDRIRHSPHPVFVVQVH